MINYQNLRNIKFSSENRLFSSFKYPSISGYKFSDWSLSSWNKKGLIIKESRYFSSLVSLLLGSNEKSLQLLIILLGLGFWSILL